MLITDSAVRETAATLAQSLGGDWTLDPNAPADGAAHLVYRDGRAISFRPIFGGATVQLWITGNAAPTLPDNATPAEHAAQQARIAVRLPEGHRYNKATTLVTDDEEEPAVIILRTLEDLLPAFDYKPRYVGHRPWIDLFDNALAAVTAERTATPAEGEAEVEPERGPEPEPKPASEPEPGPDAESAPEPEPDTERAREERAEPAPDTEAKTQPSGPQGHENGNADAEQETPPASQRPRKHTPKRRAKAAPN
ncbi:hypothetical protein [Streptomyces sp. NPDC001205]